MCELANQSLAINYIAFGNLTKLFYRDFNACAKQKAVFSAPAWTGNKAMTTHDAIGLACLFQFLRCDLQVAQ